MMMNSNLSNNIIYLMSFTLAKQKLTSKIFSIFLLHINTQVLICFNQNDLYLTFKYKMATASTQIEAFLWILIIIIIIKVIFYGNKEK